MKRITAASTVMLLLAASALAEDLRPPWWRGEISTTSQVWEFNDPVITVPGTPIPPDGPAPGGMLPLPSTQLIWEPGPPPWDHWMDFDEGAIGVIPLSGTIDVIVDNHDPKPENIKMIWMQLTWRPQDEGEVPEFILLDPPPVDEPLPMEEVSFDVANPLSWRVTVYYWELPWNPPAEQFVLGGTINVDELVIDTWCVPEPATLGLLAVGGLLTLVRRKR